MEGIYQRIHVGQAVFFGNVREVGITRGGGWAGMAKQCLNMPQAQTAFKEMRGEAVPKGMDRDFFFMPQSATTLFMAFWAPPLSMWVVVC